jgi:FMN-dependent NADH-azoreductase
VTVLHIDASILGANSASRQLSGAVMDRLRKADPGATVIYRDLAAQPLAHLSGEPLAARQGAVPESPVMQKEIADSDAVLQEFLDADTVVIGAPMYNFGIPSQLKAWIDRILVAGKTFRYSAAGPEGLAGNKQIIIAISRGGFYGPGTAAASMEHLETYLRGVFGFIGVTAPEIIVAEGLLTGPEQREKAMRDALLVATTLKAA